jgi:hypothetical protein
MVQKDLAYLVGWLFYSFSRASFVGSPAGTYPLIHFGNLKLPKPPDLVSWHIAVVYPLQYGFPALVLPVS